jgi:hypothetical protein
MSKWEKYRVEGLDKKRAAKEAAKKADQKNRQRIEVGSPEHLRTLNEIFDSSPEEQQ